MGHLQRQEDQAEAVQACIREQEDMRAAEASMYVQEFEAKASAEEARVAECQHPDDLLGSTRERRWDRFSQEQLRRERPFIAAEAAKKAARVRAAVRAWPCGHSQHEHEALQQELALHTVDHQNWREWER
eukprot:552197-Alexandrium_andersonii.AAC.1